MWYPDKYLIMTYSVSGEVNKNEGKDQKQDQMNVGEKSDDGKDSKPDVAEEVSEKQEIEDKSADTCFQVGRTYLYS